MKLTFVSNYINHHQIPVSTCLYQALGADYHFIQTEPIEAERLAMGWANQGDSLPWLRRYYESPEECRQLIAGSDVVIFGGTDEESYIADRLAAGKPVIRYSERLYKTGQWKAVSPRGLMKKYHDHTRYRHAPVYLLCAGGYVASDFHLVHSYPHKMFRWGYFPATKQYDVDYLLSRKKPDTLLWAGRFIDWKHPELAVLLAEQLRRKGLSFRLQMIGGGAMEDEIREMVRSKGLEDVVTLSGFQKPENVRTAMEQSRIFIFTSDYQEGWGAVLNEAMNSGCAVVASHAIGAVPYLLQHGRNGLIFRSGSLEDLTAQTERLLGYPGLQDRMSRAACDTICSCWNAERAAAEVLKLAEQICAGDSDRGSKAPIGSGCADSRTLQLPQEGPCSAAEIVSPHRMYRYLMQHAERRQMHAK